MKISDDGLHKLEVEEGLKLVGYPDVKGVPTVGMGHTGYVDNVPVTVGMVITKEKADELAQLDLAWVQKTINTYVKVPLNQNQFDALCSLVFNIGQTRFCTSTVLRKLNAGDYAGAADHFLDWRRSGNHPTILLERRKRERSIFNTPV